MLFTSTGQLRTSELLSRVSAVTRIGNSGHCRNWKLILFQFYGVVS